jgi:hypothetical protein
MPPWFEEFFPCGKRLIERILITRLILCRYATFQVLFPCRASWDPIHRTEWEPRPPKQLFRSLNGFHTLVCPWELYSSDYAEEAS